MKLKRKYLLVREMKMIGKENITDYIADVVTKLKELLVKYDYYENRRIKRAILSKIKRNVVKK